VGNEGGKKLVNGAEGSLAHVLGEGEWLEEEGRVKKGSWGLSLRALTSRGMT